MNFDKSYYRKSIINITPNPDQVENIEEIREVAGELLSVIFDFVPPGRNRSLALTALEDAVMRSVKGILIDEPPAF